MLLTSNIIIGSDTIIYRVATYINTYQITTKNYTIMKNISISKFIQIILMLVVTICSTIIVILTITNLNYFCVMTDSYFIPFIIIFCFSAITCIGIWMFIKLWNSMFLK